MLRSACYENYRAYEQWLRMTQTKNFAEFRQAVEMNQVPMFNICYADRRRATSSISGTAPCRTCRTRRTRPKPCPRRGPRDDLDAISRDQRAAAAVQSARRICAELQLAAVS